MRELMFLTSAVRSLSGSLKVACVKLEMSWCLSALDLRHVLASFE